MKVFIPITPRSWKRTRGAGNARYTDNKTRAYQHALAIFLRAAMARARLEPYAGAVSLDVMFVLARPKTTKCALPESKNEGDLDNLLKNVKDSGTGELYRDDGQVCELHAIKRWADEGEEPGVHVEILSL